MPKHPAKNSTAAKNGTAAKNSTTPKRPAGNRAKAKAPHSKPACARCPGTKGRPGREAFLPVSRADMDARGWDQCDFVYVCGDAYGTTPALAWPSSPACSKRTDTA